MSHKRPANAFALYELYLSKREQWVSFCSYAIKVKFVCTKNIYKYFLANVGERLQLNTEPPDPLKDDIGDTF